MNWPLLGTRAFFLAMISQNAKITITETTAMKEYLSSHSGAPSYSGGRSKLSTPGGSNSNGIRLNRRLNALPPSSCRMLTTLGLAAQPPVGPEIHARRLAAGATRPAH